MNEIAIVIVTYNSGSEIGPCLDSAMATGAEIVVVDNQSRDQTCQEVRSRGIALIANPENRGFASAVNQGFRATSAPFVLLLNPDAVLQTDLAELVFECSLAGSRSSRGATHRGGRSPAGRIHGAPPSNSGRNLLRIGRNQPPLEAQPGKLALPLL